ncbi:putative 3,4-dihydroxy-2-butanone kinase [Acorus calamus]|uniref:3,4-dihydroxy-2-butanone kinase n=1 Tax=Acorus calamus TaxID=4465 RepID=A0AAV9CFJ6_ACOCL|nr:putative 3,4-dihydroxy-2-butanone kinase [Acorus calamus]
MGVALSVCTLPGQVTSDRLGPGKMELGLGILLIRPRELNEQGYVLEAAIEAGAKEIINLKDALNEWDSKVGDGDCGSTSLDAGKDSLTAFLLSSEAAVNGAEATKNMSAQDGTELQPLLSKANSNLEPTV